MTPQEREERIKQIEEREKNATKGPWEMRLAQDGDWLVDQNAFRLSGAKVSFKLLADKSDTEFIAHARQDIPYLQGEVKRLEAENARLRVGMVDEAILRKENAGLREKYDSSLIRERETVVARRSIQSKLDRAVKALDDVLCERGKLQGQYFLATTPIVIVINKALAELKGE